MVPPVVNRSSAVPLTEITKDWTDAYDAGKATVETLGAIFTLNEVPGVYSGERRPRRVDDGVPRSDKYELGTKTLLKRDANGELTLQGPIMAEAAPTISPWDQFCDFWIELANFLFRFRNVDTRTFNWAPSRETWQERAPFVMVAGGAELREKLFPAWMYSGETKLDAPARVSRAAALLLPMFEAQERDARTGDLEQVATLLAEELDALYSKPLSDGALKRLQTAFGKASAPGTAPYWNDAIAAERARAAGAKDELDLLTINTDAFTGFDGYTVEAPSGRELSATDKVLKDGKLVAWNDETFVDARRDYAKRKITIDRLNAQADLLHASGDLEGLRRLVGEANNVTEASGSARVLSNGLLVRGKILGYIADELGVFDGEKKTMGKAAYGSIASALATDATSLDAACAFADGIITIDASSFKGIAEDVLGITCAAEAVKARAALAKFGNDPRAQAKIAALTGI